MVKTTNQYIMFFSHYKLTILGIPNGLGTPPFLMGTDFMGEYGITWQEPGASPESQ